MVALGYMALCNDLPVANVRRACPIAIQPSYENENKITFFAF